MTISFSKTYTQQSALIIVMSILAFACITMPAQAATEAEQFAQMEAQLNEASALVAQLVALRNDGRVLGIVAPTASLAPTAKPSVVLKYPNKGESFKIGDQMRVEWEARNVPENSIVCVRLFDDINQEKPILFTGKCLQSTQFHKLTDEITKQYKAGSYRIQIDISTPPGGEKGLIASDVSDKPVKIAPATPTAKPSVVLKYPNKGESFKIGDQMTVEWDAKNVPAESTVCVSLDPVDTEGNFAFPSQGGCQSAKNGPSKVSGTLIQNAGYDLKPGKYNVYIKVSAKPSGGKDGGGIAFDQTDKPITIIVKQNDINIQLTVIKKQIQQIEEQILKLRARKDELTNEYNALMSQIKG